MSDDIEHHILGIIGGQLGGGNGSNRSKPDNCRITGTQSIIDHASITRLVDAYHDVVEFKPGDEVELKAGMRTFNRPYYGQPAIVLEVLDEPLYREDKNTLPGNLLHKLPMDLLLACTDDEGDFMRFHAASYMFKHYDYAEKVRKAEAEKAKLRANSGSENTGALSEAEINAIISGDSEVSGGKPDA